MDRPASAHDHPTSRAARDEEYELRDEIRSKSEALQGVPQEDVGSSTQHQDLQPAVGCSRCQFLGAPVGDSCQECGQATVLSPGATGRVGNTEAFFPSIEMLPTTVYKDLKQPRTPSKYISRLDGGYSSTQSSENDGDDELSSSEGVADSVSTTSNETVKPTDKKKGRGLSASVSTKSNETAKPKNTKMERECSVAEGPFTSYNSLVEAKHKRLREERRRRSESDAIHAPTASHGLQSGPSNESQPDAMPRPSSPKPDEFASEPSRSNNTRPDPDLTREEHIRQLKLVLENNAEATIQAQLPRKSKQTQLETRNLTADTAASYSLDTSRNPTPLQLAHSNPSVAATLVSATGEITESQPPREPGMFMSTKPTHAFGVEDLDASLVARRRRMQEIEQMNRWQRFVWNMQCKPCWEEPGACFFKSPERGEDGTGHGHGDGICVMGGCYDCCCAMGLKHCGGGGCCEGCGCARCFGREQVCWNWCDGWFGGWSCLAKKR